jgi:hypothetical protein
VLGRVSVALRQLGDHDELVVTFGAVRFREGGEH